MQQAQRGLTLTEILIVLTLLLVLVSLAAPGMTHLLGDRRASAALQNIASAIQLARSTAIMNASLVTLCPSRDGESCGGAWHIGSIVFTDRNGNRKLEEEDRLVQQLSHGDLPGTIRWRAFRNRRYLQFTPEGFTRYQNGNFTFCHQSKAQELHRQLVLSRTGRLRYARDTDGDGLAENSRGQPIDCN